MIERLHALLPGGCVWRLWLFGPIFRRPLGRFMLRIAAEFQNVPGRDAHVFEQFPWRMWRALGPPALVCQRNPFDGFFPIDMSLAPIQRTTQLLTQSAFVHMSPGAHFSHYLTPRGG